MVIESGDLLSGTSMNVLYLLFFIVLLILTIYLLYVGMSRGIDLLFPSESPTKDGEGRESEKGVKEDDKVMEKFGNISITDLLLQFNDEGEFIGDGDDMDDIGKKPMDHPKNREVKERDSVEIQEKSPEKVQNKPLNDDAIVFCVDKSKSDKELHFTILNDKSLRYLEINGYYDNGIVLQVKDIKKRDITVIKNKIYNKYTMIYQTRDDKDPLTYVMEYRPNQERFIKIATEKEDKIFYLEKIQSGGDREGDDLRCNSLDSSDPKRVDHPSAFPLYAIYEFAEKIGTVYLIENQENREMRKYAIVLEKEKQANINLIAFGLTLYLAHMTTRDQSA